MGQVSRGVLLMAVDVLAKLRSEVAACGVSGGWGILGNVFFLNYCIYLKNVHDR